MKVFVCSMHGVPVRAFTKQRAADQYVSLARAVGIDVTVYNDLEIDIDDEDEIEPSEPALLPRREIEGADNVVELSKFREGRKGLAG
jgi:hypothetical protein